MPLLAQAPSDTPSDVLRHPGWNAGIFAGGGTTVDSTPSGSNLVLGVRLGRVLTDEHGPGILRGTYEMAIDIVPLDEYWINGGQYAGGVDPVVFKWNFTSGSKIVPYFAAVGGALFSNHNLPPGDTSQINFTSGPEIGAQIFGNGKELLGHHGEGLSPVECVNRQPQSRAERERAVHAGIYLALGARNIPQASRRL